MSLALSFVCLTNDVGMCGKGVVVGKAPSGTDAQQLCRGSEY